MIDQESNVRYSIAALYERAARDWPDAECIVFPDARETYASVFSRGSLIAGGLRRLGVGPGDRIAVFLPNCVEYVVMQIASAVLDATLVKINARYKGDELAYVLASSAPEVVVTSDIGGSISDYPGILASALRAAGSPARAVCLGKTERPGFMSGSDLESGQPSEFDPAKRARHPAVIMYTSGTTAQPRGCVQSHEALLAAAIAGAEMWDVSSTTRSWNPLPMFHVGGTFPLLAHACVGGTVVSQTFFDAGEALSLFARERCEMIFPYIETIVQALITHDAFSSEATALVRVVHQIGDSAILERVQAAFPSAAVVNAYGMTETCGSIVVGDPRDDEPRRMAAIGRLSPGGRVRVENEDGEEVNEPGARGELIVGGTQLASGYLDEDPDGPFFIDEDGNRWFRTGDLGSIDEDGYLTYRGRLKDMLKVGGENVAAAEIEGHLLKIPGVRIAVVVGVPDAKYTEVPAAFIELLPGVTMDEATVIARCEGNISSFKVPRYVRFVADWPMSATKIQKHVLRERLIEELGAAPVASPGQR